MSHQKYHKNTLFGLSHASFLVDLYDRLLLDALTRHWPKFSRRHKMKINWRLLVKIWLGLYISETRRFANEQWRHYRFGVTFDLFSHRRPSHPLPALQVIVSSVQYNPL